MKKKMKKIFSKITILVLLVAILIPYTSIPKVEAAESCEGGEWEYHTNYYFFLLAETPFSWAEKFADSNGNKSTFATYNWTEFLYTFPSDGSTIDFLGEDFVKITRDATYSTRFNAGADSSIESWTAGQFYYELSRTDLESTYASSNLKQLVLNAKQSGTGSSTEDRIVTYLIHGDWAHVADTTSLNSAINLTNAIEEYKINSYGLDVDASIEDLVQSSVLPMQNSTSAGKLGNATITQNSAITIDKGPLKTAIQNFNKDQKPNNHVYMGNDTSKTGNTPLIGMVIGREFKIEDLFTTSSTRVLSADDTKTTTDNYATDADGEIKGKLGSSGEEIEFWLPITENQKIKSNKIEGEDKSVVETVKLKHQTSGNANYWFLSPTLYQMSYRVCKASAEATEDTVSVTYHKNADDTVESMPTKNPEIITKGSAYTISSTEPTRSGYTFQGWANNEGCTGTKYESGVKLSDSLNENTNLYACWGSTEEGKQKDTGVLTYTGLFTGIIALAGGSYYLIKKKNLFKKI